jgi:hypothetical protein
METARRLSLVAPSILLLVCFLSVPGWADYAAGQRAFDEGDYATALKEWRPLGAKGAQEARMRSLYPGAPGVRGRRRTERIKLKTHF